MKNISISNKNLNKYDIHGCLAFVDIEQETYDKQCKLKQLYLDLLQLLDNLSYYDIEKIQSFAERTMYLYESTMEFIDKTPDDIEKVAKRKQYIGSDGERYTSNQFIVTKGIKLETLDYELKSVGSIVNTLNKARALGQDLGFNINIHEYEQYDSEDFRGTYISIYKKEQECTDESPFVDEPDTNEIKIPNNWNRIYIDKSLLTTKKGSGADSGWALSRFSDKLVLHIQRFEQLKIDIRRLLVQMKCGKLKLYVSSKEITLEQLIKMVEDEKERLGKSK